jgi:hypothetical protein
MFTRLRAVCLAFIVLVYAQIGFAQAPGSAASSPGSMAPIMVVRAGSSDTLYVLWQNESCTLLRCVRLERSINGGQTFTSVAVPLDTSKLRMDVPPVSQMYFANPMDGYAMVLASDNPYRPPSVLMQTTNGGRSWSKVHFASTVSIQGFAASRHYFYAVTAQCASTTSPCKDDRLTRSVAGTSTWTSLLASKNLAVYWANGFSMTAYGNDVWLTTQNQTKSPYSPFVATSVNRGRTFTSLAQPDLTSVNQCQLSSMSSQVLWAQCDQGMMRGDIVYSSNGGANWSEQRCCLLGEFEFGIFEPVSKGAAYLINEVHPRSLYRVSSESSSPRHVALMPRVLGWASLDFTNGEQGLALSDGPNESTPYLLWRTDDGGRQWQRVLL